MSITVTDTGGAANVTLSNFALKYNGVAITNGQTGLVLPGAGKTLLIGATATYIASLFSAPVMISIRILRLSRSRTLWASKLSSASTDCKNSARRRASPPFGGSDKIPCRSRG
jgi:hypothetical protein